MTKQMVVPNICHDFPNDDNKTHIPKIRHITIAPTITAFYNDYLTLLQSLNVMYSESVLGSNFWTTVTK